MYISYNNIIHLKLQIAKECGRHKRPPFSYMTLIQMGLNSREDKRMTLREICRWIEDTFPYYKHTAKPGWKVGFGLIPNIVYVCILCEDTAFLPGRT